MKPPELQHAPDLLLVEEVEDQEPFEFSILVEAFPKKGTIPQGGVLPLKNSPTIHIDISSLEKSLSLALSKIAHNPFSRKEFNKKYSLDKMFEEATEVISSGRLGAFAHLKWNFSLFKLHPNIFGYGYYLYDYNREYDFLGSFTRFLDILYTQGFNDRELEIKMFEPLSPEREGRESKQGPKERGFSSFLLSKSLTSRREDGSSPMLKVVFHVPYWSNDNIKPVFYGKTGRVKKYVFEVKASVSAYVFVMNGFDLLSLKLSPPPGWGSKETETRESISDYVCSGLAIVNQDNATKYLRERIRIVSITDKPSDSLKDIFVREKRSVISKPKLSGGSFLFSCILKKYGSLEPLLNLSLIHPEGRGASRYSLCLGSNSGEKVLVHPFEETGFDPKLFATIIGLKEGMRFIDFVLHRKDEFAGCRITKEYLEEVLEKQATRTKEVFDSLLRLGLEAGESPVGKVSFSSFDGVQGFHFSFSIDVLGEASGPDGSFRSTEFVLHPLNRLHSFVRSVSFSIVV